ncbi:MAG: polysaccharide deacetylase family protein [Microbacteriaceae bacterium]
MDRRSLLTSIAAAAVVSLTGCAAERGRAASPTASVFTPTPTPTPTPRPTPATIGAPVPLLKKVPLPGGRITELPGEGNHLAWTVDDGSNSQVVAAYAQFAKDSGVRLTFFLNGTYPSWLDNAPALRPLVESGQVQLGNHTFSHADLTELSSAGIIHELQSNADFIKNTYGVTAAPFYRPPYGYTNSRTESVASSIGYTAPVLWYGSLSDSGLITPEQVVQFADTWFLPQHIVIGHANYLPVTTVYSRLVDIIHQRQLQTVTLNDVFQT